MNNRIMVLGGTGLVGGHVIRLLRQLPDCGGIVAPTRRPLQDCSGVDNPIVDFAQLPEDAHWWAVDGVINCLGTTIAKAGSREAFQQQDMAYPLKALRLAKQAGARAAAITSSLGANAKSSNFYLRTKGIMEASTCQVGFESVTIVRPSIIDGDRHESRPAEKLGLMALKALSPITPRRYRPSNAGDIAACLLQSLTVATDGTSCIEAENIPDYAIRWTQRWTTGH